MKLFVLRVVTGFVFVMLLFGLVVVDHALLRIGLTALTAGLCFFAGTAVGVVLEEEFGKKVDVDTKAIEDARERFRESLLRMVQVEIQDNPRG